MKNFKRIVSGIIIIISIILSFAILMINYPINNIIQLILYLILYFSCSLLVVKTVGQEDLEEEAKNVK